MNRMNRIEEELRQEVRKLLETNAIDVFVGYEESALPLRTSVCFVRSPEDVGRLVWNRSCSLNLAAFLPQLFQKPSSVRGSWTPPRVGVLAKGCDSRSVVGLVRARQVERDRLFVLGVPCEGMIDRRKVARSLGEGSLGALAGAEIRGDTVRALGTDGSSAEVGLDTVRADACLTCTHRQPVLSDLSLGEVAEPAKAADDYADVAAFEARPPDERWNYFVAELSRCVRCYACRQACPNCYCRECFAEETSPRWLGVTTDAADVMMFHLGRLMHQAGRCVDCGACVAACPQGIDLRLFNRKVVRDVEELFGESPPASPDEAEALCAFTMDDDQGFMTEP